MRHFVLPARQSGNGLAAQAATAFATPLTAADYLKLRRTAAGLTVDQLARQIVTVIAHNRPLPRRAPTTDEIDRRYTAMRGTLLLLERPNSRCRDHELLDVIRSIMPFDPAVYGQLVSEPADRHPMICRSCGCSGHDQCADDDSCCHWVTPALCSHCVEGGLRAAVRSAAA